MSLLGPLLDIQKLDLAADAARVRSASLPERESLPRLERELAEIDSQFATAQAERSERLAEEGEVGAEVSQIAREIEAAELERYSGRRMDRDAATTHDDSQSLLRERQRLLEERELALLEAIDEVESRISDHQSARAANRIEAERFTETLRQVESEVATEIENLSQSRRDLETKIPGNLIAVYDRVRAQPRTAGRGAAALAEGRCGACQIKLPVHELSKMLAEPQDALIQCPQCRRVLVR